MLLLPQHAPFCTKYSTTSSLNLTSVFVILFVECCSEIFQKITHAFYNQKHPCKGRRNVYYGKKGPPKRDPGLSKWDPCMMGEFILI